MEETVDEILYCQWHPKVETALRCYQCGAPICSKCARRTPIGYICPDCRKSHSKRFDTARSYDFIIAAVVGVVLGAVASLIPSLPLVGWYIFFISPLAGTIIAEAVSRLTRRRQNRHLWKVVVVAVVIGSLPMLLSYAFGGIAVFMSGNAWGIWDVFFVLIHLPLVIGAIILRLRLH
jgi:MFS family permease